MSKGAKTLLKEMWKWKVTRAKDQSDPRVQDDNWSLIDSVGYPFTWEIWSDDIIGGYILYGSPEGLEIEEHFPTLSEAKQFVKRNLLHRLFDNDDNDDTTEILDGRDCVGNLTA